MKAQGNRKWWRQVLGTIGTVLLISSGNVASGSEGEEGDAAGAFALMDPAAPTFRADILPIIQARCTHCHGPTRMRSEDFTDYGTVVSMKEQVYDAVVVRKSMPIGMRLPPDAVSLIATWIQNGMPEG